MFPVFQNDGFEILVFVVVTLGLCPVVVTRITLNRCMSSDPKLMTILTDVRLPIAIRLKFWFVVGT
jgi:hypothetical protein